MFRFEHRYNNEAFKSTWKTVMREIGHLSDLWIMVGRFHNNANLHGIDPRDLIDPEFVDSLMESLNENYAPPTSQMSSNAYEFNTINPRFTDDSSDNDELTKADNLVDFDVEELDNEFEINEHGSTEMEIDNTNEVVGDIPTDINNIDIGKPGGSPIAVPIPITNATTLDTNDTSTRAPRVGKLVPRVGKRAPIVGDLSSKYTLYIVYSPVQYLVKIGITTTTEIALLHNRYSTYFVDKFKLYAFPVAECLDGFSCRAIEDVVSYMVNQYPLHPLSIGVRLQKLLLNFRIIYCTIITF